MRNPRVLCNYYMATRPRARACIFRKTLGLYLLLTTWTHYALWSYIAICCIIVS